jgi:choline-glycine betaine transporter
MRWIKVAAIVVAALIAFIVLESAFHLLQIAAIVLAIGVVIALAVKAHSQYRIARERRAQVKAERRQVREQRKSGTRPATPEPLTAAPAVPRQYGTAAPGHGADVDDELARLKREMGAS